MKIILKLFLLAFLFLNVQSCNTTEPPIDDTQPGRRDYVWTVDTLDGLNSPRFRMWGSSPSDMWTITHSAWEVSISKFDGSEWASYGVPGLINPFSIYGFSNNNIFTGAENGKIWKFDGNGWNQFAELTKDGHSDIVFDNMWGESTDNFFAIGAYPDSAGLGNNRVIANYKNHNWSMFNTDRLKGIVEHLYKNKTDGKIYLQVIKFSNTYDTTFIYEYNQGKYTKLYTSVWDKYWANISLINNEVCFVLRTEIARRVNNKFQTVLKLDNTNFYQRIWGRNSKDIFLNMTDGLAHYNGSDIEYLFYFNITPRTQIYGAALFNNDAFFLVYEAQTGLSLVCHGILK